MRRIDDTGDDLAGRHGFPGAARETVHDPGRRRVDRQRRHAPLELLGRFLRERQARAGTVEAREPLAGSVNPVVGLREGAFIGFGGCARDRAGGQKPRVRLEDLPAVFLLSLEIAEFGLRVRPLGGQPQRLRARIERFLRKFSVLQPEKRRACRHPVPFVSQ